ncbi:MAG: hypothetical protein IPN76_23145 [Saprospiraceae bacterium]|nr:hypothetical protein [Saprospiraceae bacterium]
MSFKSIALILMVTLAQPCLLAQRYFGIGWHWSMPMKIENCCNPYFQATAIPVPAYSLTYKKEFSNERKRLWYYEVGLTGAALGYRTVVHDNDTMGIAPWGISKDTHRGFPSVLFGTGRNIALINNHEFIVGLEGSLRIVHTMGGIISSAFSLEYEDELVTFPLFLRANLRLCSALETAWSGTCSLTVLH